MNYAALIVAVTYSILALIVLYFPKKWDKEHSWMAKDDREEHRKFIIAVWLSTAVFACFYI